MRRTQIYLEDKHHKFLSVEAEKKGISIAEFIRQLIDEAMPKEDEYDNNPFWDLGNDGFTTGETRGSIEHDKIIYKQRR